MTATMRSLVLTVLISQCFSYQDILAVRGPDGTHVPLDMAIGSVAYIFTQNDESDKIAIDYIQQERHRNKTFDAAWEHACRNMISTNIPKGLTKEHMLALFAYTAHNTSFYKTFNTALRLYGATDAIYAKSFNFKSFHYLLSIAVDTLKMGPCDNVSLTYRGFSRLAEALVGSDMRFGYFASSSLDYNVASHYINTSTRTNTMLEIHSLYGASIQKYSQFPEEQEVLIPPYEVFRVTQKTNWDYGVKISLTGHRKKGTMVRLERDHDGELVVLRCEGTIISALDEWWILVALLPVSAVPYL